MQLSASQVEAYREEGFLIVEGVLSADEVTALRAVTDGFVERARAVSEHDEVYDLEPSHSAAEPRVRRIKSPHAQHDTYAGVMRHPKVLGILQQLVSPSIRFDTSKLNMKAAGYGAAVEWHQDWAFYPHTNDDLLRRRRDAGRLARFRTARCSAFRAATRARSSTITATAISAAPSTPRRRGVELRDGQALHRPRRQHLDPPRADHPRLCPQHLGQDAPALAVPVPRRRCLAAGRRRSSRRAGRRWQALLLCGDDDPVVPRVTEVPVRLPLPAAEARGLDLREPARAEEELLRQGRLSRSDRETRERRPRPRGRRFARPLEEVVRPSAAGRRRR